MDIWSLRDPTTKFSNTVRLVATTASHFPYGDRGSLHRSLDFYLLWMSPNNYRVSEDHSRCNRWSRFSATITRVEPGPAGMSLKDYRRKRKFKKTPEPAGQLSERSSKRKPSPRARTFVVQKHAARRLHYDLRLEINGVLKSWAVPKGPSLNPSDKRLAVMTEDHPLEYGGFEGVIPEGNYGAGTVLIWDNGTYEPEGDLDEQLARGDLKFSLVGKRLRGSFVLVRTKRRTKPGVGEWLLIKHRDDHADTDWDIDAHSESAVSGRTLSEVRQGYPVAETAGAKGPLALEGAVPASMPTVVKPMLASLVEEPFSGSDWIFELKWDGIRALARLRDNDSRLYARTGRDVTSHYPELSELSGNVAVSEAILDGEIVVLDTEGRGDFERLQSRMNVADPSKSLQRSAPVTYYVFDVLYADGCNLRRVPLIERKHFLKRILRPGKALRFSDHIEEKGKELFELAADRGAEGIVGKRIDSAYVEGRSPLWVKVKTVREVDAVIGGFTAPQGGRKHFGALLTGLYEGRHLRFIGGVGSGFSEEKQASLFDQLEGLEETRCPFAEPPQVKQAMRWVKPELVARVKFHNWTEERRLRQPVFIGLRTDLDPRQCLLEDSKPTSDSRPEIVRVTATPQVRGKKNLERELERGREENVVVELDGRRFRLTHLNKVYFPKQRYTKRRLLAYYYRVADYMLPFLINRPLVLHRYPNGIEGESFYQKEAGPDAPEWMETIAIHWEERKADIRYYVANDLAGLLYLSNLGCIEHHPWSSSVGDLERPDYVFFDLDPSEEADFATVVRIARAICDLMDRLSLEVFLKTSGASGLHIYLPLESDYTYEQVRAFAEIVAHVIAEKMPGQVTLERHVNRRPKDKVYFDYSQNAYGRPLAVVYGARPVAAASVSTPISRRELRRTLSPRRFTLANMSARLKKSGDLWADFWKRRQRLEPALEQLEQELRRRTWKQG